ITLFQVKCEKYWPSFKAQTYGHIQVHFVKKTPEENWIIRDFMLENVANGKRHNIRHFHFIAWPDHGVPENTDLLIRFRNLVREHMNLNNGNSPTVVHCSAGVGRTGTLIALDHLIHQIKLDNIVDIYGIVYELRMHRPLMVQTEVSDFFH
ncbi:PTPRJ phosphatase, partial [Polypterus senegalus]|nr:PTPRJ phosphatase [Polypterus senegalus]